MCGAFITFCPYDDGLLDGFEDGFTISEKPNNGKHTYGEYIRIKEKYESAIYSFASTEYEQGYGNGLDCAAIYLRTTVADAGTQDEDY